MYGRVQYLRRLIVAVPVWVAIILTVLASPGGLLAAPMPRVRFDQSVIPPDVPAEALIGEDFKFRVRFRNDPSQIGYAPFVDLVLDRGGANLPKPCPCDGITFVSASLISINGGPLPLAAQQRTAACVPSTALVSIPHPFPDVLPVLAPAGSQLVTIELPFGSFDPTQPENVIEVTVHVSQNADAGHPLQIAARGGFRYGATAADDAPPDWPVVSDVINAVPPADQQTDSTQWVTQAQVTPTVLIISKKYLGPENETATGPNFPRQYELTLDIADGQTLQNVTITDHLPNNVAFLQVISSNPACFTATTTPVPGAAHNPPLNDLIFQCPSITGGPGIDATIIFSFFIPELDGNGNPILPQSCDFVLSVNDVKASGLWTPIDTCDVNPVTASSDVTPADHTLTDKCLAIQKTVVDLSGGAPAHPIPGDTLQYTLEFQLSDFRTADDLKVEDLLSDGQTLVPSSLTLSVTDQCGTTSGAIPTTAWTQSTPACTTGAPPPGTALDIDVSAAMIALAGSGGPSRHQNGILTGGHATASPSNVPATGTITFLATIDDAYHCPVASPHDLFVDKDDFLTNAVTIGGTTLADGSSCASIPTTAVATPQDTSATLLLMATDFLQKTVYAVRRGSLEICSPNSSALVSPCPALPDVLPGDLVTFRITNKIPSADAESLTIQDWLPLPIFLAGGGSFTNSPCVGIPAVGVSCYGPANSLTAVVPAYSDDPVTNSIKFNYGTFNSTANNPETIDLLFTREVTPAPYADGLQMTNQAQLCESNTFGTTFCQSAIAQVHLREPDLRVTKGIVSTTNPNAVFSPALPAPVPFQLPGTSCPRFSGGITSANLGATPINSNVSGIDANDCVTFAIVVENTGGAPAYDVVVREAYPLGPTLELECYIPDFTTMCVTDGTGAALPFTTLSGFLGFASIFLQNPLPAAGTNGANIAVITFDACVVGDVEPQCCQDTASIQHYASTPNGPSFPDAGFGGPLSETADLCVLPQGTKSLVTTSEAHTAGTPLGTPLVPEQVAIGEVVRYHLRVVVPESSATSTYQLQDSLPAGLSFLPGTVSAVASSGLTVANLLPVITGSSSCGGSLLMNFGTVANANNNSAQETIDVEFNALVCNVPTNQNGTALNNSFSVIVDGTPKATSNAVPVVVVEPNIAITKTASVPTLVAGATASYTITLTNNGTATAFEVRLTDQLPACLTNLSNIQVTAAATNQSAGSLIDLTLASIPVNGTVTVHYTATVGCVDCNQLINTARVRWSSLPGGSGSIVNPTGSQTPGASGTVNGERDGSGGVNDYTATATATLCCMLVTNETFSCNSNGSFTDTFTVTNFTNVVISSVGVFVTSPSNVTITPSTIAIPPLAPGASTTVTVNIGGAGAVSGATVCYTVALLHPAASCRIDRCTTLISCCAPPPTGMVAWYPLDELAGATAIDDIAPAPASSVNNVGTPVPGPVGNGPEPVGGEVRGALYFFGPHVEVPSHSELNFNRGSFSIDAWVSAVNCGGSYVSPIVDKFDPNSNTGYAFYLIQPANGVGRLELKMNGSTFTSTGSIVATASPSANTGPWFHVAVVFDVSSGTGTFYINGSPAGTFATSSGPDNNTVPLWIGEKRFNANGYCEIAVDELELFNRAVTQPELIAIFEAGAHGKCKPTCTPRPAGLLDWWTFDETAGTTAGDTAGFINNAGTYRGQPTPVPGLVDGALQFDGVDDYVEVPHQAEVNFPGCGGFPGIMSLTIDVWVRTTVTAGLQTILDKRDNNGNARGYHLFVFNGRAGFQINGTNFGAPATGPNFVNVADGQWHFIAVSLSICSAGSGGFLYVDGKNVLTLPGALDLNNTSNLFIGARNPIYGNNFFTGAIDELELFNRALTEAELNAIYTAREHGKCKATAACANSALSIGPASLPGLRQDTDYDPAVTFTASGGVAPFEFAVTAGGLPPGMVLLTDGRLIGSAAAGTYSFAVTAVDSNGCRVEREYQLSVGRGRRRAVHH